MKFTTHTDMRCHIKCPFCNEEHNPWEDDKDDQICWSEGEDFEFTCKSCDRIFNASLNNIPHFSSEPLEDDSCWED